MPCAISDSCLHATRIQPHVSTPGCGKNKAVSPHVVRYIQAFITPHRKIPLHISIYLDSLWDN